jgi:hypothetical protein
MRRSASANGTSRPFAGKLHELDIQLVDDKDPAAPAAEMSRQ